MKTETERESKICKSAYVLVVVDMQCGFRASLTESTLAAVATEINEARSNGQAIVILEYAKYPATHESLLNLVQGYEKCVVETKFDDDGSLQIIEACLFNGFSAARFRLCGVNTHACVQSTALGLADRLDESTVQVVKTACNDDYPQPWTSFAKRANLQLV